VGLCHDAGGGGKWDIFDLSASGVDSPTGKNYKRLFKGKKRRCEIETSCGGKKVRIHISYQRSKFWMRKLVGHAATCDRVLYGRTRMNPFAEGEESYPLI